MINGQASSNNIRAWYRRSICVRAMRKQHRDSHTVMDRESNYLAPLRSTLNWPLCT